MDPVVDKVSSSVISQLGPDLDGHMDVPMTEDKVMQDDIRQPDFGKIL